jgi:hypothetical protein
LPRRVYNRAHASVRLHGGSLDPLAVTHALKLPADHVHRDGEPRLARSRKGAIVEHAPYRGGMWSMSSEPWVPSPRLAVHLEWLLEQLEPRKAAIAVLLADGVTADFFCFSSGSTRTPPSLPRGLRERAAALGIDIQVDHYDDSARRTSGHAGGS